MDFMQINTNVSFHFNTNILVDPNQIADETRTHVNQEDDINRDEDEEEEVKEISMNEKPLIQQQMNKIHSR